MVEEFKGKEWQKYEISVKKLVKSDGKEDNYSVLLSYKFEVCMSDDKQNSNSKFLKGTMILTISSIVVKVIGSLNWIILSRVLGGEGIGLYQMGFPIYLMAITVSSAGVPVAIYIITSE